MKIIKLIFLLNFFFLSLSKQLLAEDLFQSLISTYINNKELNSQREKTKAVDENLIQSY